jgi:hypothetical protein
MSGKNTKKRKSYTLNGVTTFVGADEGEFEG